MKQNFSKVLLRTSAAKFDLIVKALKSFGSKELRIENERLILENTDKSAAYVHIKDFLGGEKDVNFCIDLPKSRLAVVTAVKTNSDISVVDIDPSRASIQFGNFTAVLEKRFGISNQVLLPVQSYREITQACNFKLYRNLLASMCRTKGVSLYVHAKEGRIVSVGTGLDSLDVQPDYSDWVEGLDIVINCNLSLRCDNPNINLQIVKVEEKHHLLVSYTLTDNFVVRHFFKTN